ncbi:MAG: hypothetical protein ACON4U_19215 [Myxococcota bacterium]
MLLFTIFMTNGFAEPPATEIFSGFRMGYGYVEDERLFTNHLMILGWDHMAYIDTGANIDVVVAGNISLGGMNQSEVLPSGHLVVGYQMFDSIQFGVGPVVTIESFEPEPIPRLNMIVAAGWNIALGDAFLPLHVGYVPDPDGRWRAYVTTGMNWQLRRSK